MTAVLDAPSVTINSGKVFEARALADAISAKLQNRGLSAEDERAIENTFGTPCPSNEVMTAKLVTLQGILGKPFSGPDSKGI